MNLAFLRAALSISVVFSHVQSFLQLQFTIVCTAFLKGCFLLSLVGFAVYFLGKKTRSIAVIDGRWLHLEKLCAQGGYGNHVSWHSCTVKFCPSYDLKHMRTHLLYISTVYIIYIHIFIPLLFKYHLPG